MNSLFIAQTPLQLLNCIEASKKYNEKGIYVLFYDCDENYRRMLKLVDLFDVLNVHYYRLTSTFRMLFPLILLFKFKQYKSKQKFNRIYFGTYASWASFLINYLDVNETILVDDGHKTVGIIKNPKLMGLYKKKWPKFLDKKYVQESRLFTIYSSFGTENGWSCDENNLKFVTEYFNQHNSQLSFSANLMDEHKIQIFIGSNVSDKCNAFDDHVKVIAEKARNEGKKLFYIMHRYDDEKRLFALADSLNFTCIKYDLPLELLFSSIWDQENEVWSHGSTAVDTLQLIYRSLNARIFQMPLDTLKSDFQKEAFSNLYLYYQEKEQIALDDSLMS